MSSSGPNAGMETPAPLNSVVIALHSGPFISQKLHQLVHILHFCLQ